MSEPIMPSAPRKFAIPVSDMVIGDLLDIFLPFKKCYLFLISRDLISARVKMMIAMSTIV